MNKLDCYGVSERFLGEASLYPAFELGRVISQYRKLYKIITNKGEVFAEVSGKFRYEIRYLCDYPVVGDFVMLDQAKEQSGNRMIHKVLTRKSSFERTSVGAKDQTQVVAANIDYIFICMSLNLDYNLRRLERYLSIAWNSGATPVIILTKSDLCINIEQKLIEMDQVAIGVDVIVASGMEGDSYLQLLKYFKRGITASFIGSSGVGKSTLINRLAGKEILLTSEIGKDDKGRHTTTHRELIPLPQGGVVIDTPGMRELGVDSVDLAKAFADLEKLAESCRFKDCSHKDEPGCAVRDAIEKGEVDRKRLESYHKLKKEARYDGLTSKQIETEKLNSMFQEFGGMKNARKYIKKHNKRSIKY